MRAVYYEIHCTFEGLKADEVETSPFLDTNLAYKSSSFLPPRLDAQELLDLGVGSEDDVAANFADLRRINHFLGGLRALTLHLYPRLLASDSPSTIVDIGTGSGDLLSVINLWALSRNLDLKVWGLDYSARNLSVASRATPSPRQHLIHADALHLPFRNGSVDYFISSLLLHHLPLDQVILLLTQSFKSANKGIIMSDLVRGWAPLVAFKVSQPIFARNFLTRGDGATSIRRAYTPAELTHLAQAAGLTNARVYQHPMWRMTLVADK